MLSELYFYLWFPTQENQTKTAIELWIAFRIVFLLMIPNTKNYRPRTCLVVNCFQNCIFTYDSQLTFEYRFFSGVVNCFQNCIFTYDSQLWKSQQSMTNVVNCFQNCIFTYDSQPNELFRKNCYCCELLSELYFYLWFPTFSPLLMRPEWLWIAFRIVFLLMIPNKG